MPSRESARNPRENIETLNIDSRSRLSLIKLMVDVSVQTYSFLEVTAVRYDEKDEYRDKKERTVFDSSTESIQETISRRNNRLHDTCSRNISNLFPRKSVTQCTQKL